MDYPLEIKEEYNLSITQQIAVKHLFKRNTTNEKTTTLTFRLCKVCNMPRVAGTALRLPKEVFGNSLKDLSLPIVEECLPDLVYIIAAAIQNDNKEPSLKLRDFIENNFDHEQLFVGFNHAINQLGMQSFLNCLILAGGANILRSRPELQEVTNG